MGGLQSDMHGRCEEDTDRSLSSHTDSSSSPNYFKTEEKWIRASYSHYYVKEWYTFPVFAIVTVTDASFQSHNQLICCQYQTSDYLSAAAFGSYRDFNWVVACSFLTWQVTN